MSAASSDEMNIYLDVKDLYDQKASLVYENCTRALCLAERTLNNEMTVDFLKCYLGKLVKILLDQNPSRIGAFEQGHVEKSLGASVEILAQLLVPKLEEGESDQLQLNLVGVLVNIFNFHNTYYKGGKVQWQHLPGHPQTRISLLQKFQRRGGFSTLLAYLTSPTPSSLTPTASSTWIGAESFQVILTAVTAVDPGHTQAGSDELRREVMRQLLTLPEDTLKRESTDSIAALIKTLQPLKKSDPFFKQFNDFWLQHTSRLMTCNSILLKLFAWEQFHSIILQASASRSPPLQYVITGAGTEEVNGLYDLLPSKTDQSAKDPPMYRKSPTTPGAKEFTLVRCNMKSQSKWWYLSIVDAYSPGGKKDVDYYQHKSTVDQHAEPPELNWETTYSPVLGLSPAPVLTRMARAADPDGFHETVLRWISEQRLVEGVFGPGIHREIVSRSRSLVLMLAEEDVLAEESVRAIYKVGMSHQEEDVAEEVFGLLACCSRYMNDETYGSLMGSVMKTIDGTELVSTSSGSGSGIGNAGGGGHILRVVMFVRRLHSEGVSQMRAGKGREHLGAVVWALHQHPLFAAYPSLPSSVSSVSPVEDLLLQCLQNDSDRSELFLKESFELLGDKNGGGRDRDREKDRIISTLQFFLFNHSSLGLGRILATGELHRALMVDLSSFLTTHFPSSTLTMSLPASPPSSPSAGSFSALDSFARRLHLLRCAFAVTPSISMTLEQLQALWTLVTGPDEREQLFRFLRQAASTLPSSEVIFTPQQCLFIFEEMLCSVEIDWSMCGKEAYRCFETFLSALPLSAPEDVRKKGRDTLWTMSLHLPHQAVAEEAVQRLLRAYLESASEEYAYSDSDCDGESDGERTSGGAYGELMNRVFLQLQDVQSSLSADVLPSTEPQSQPLSLRLPLKVRSMVSRCITLLTGLLGKANIHHDPPHGVRGSLFRIQVSVRYQEVLPSTPSGYYSNVSYPSPANNLSVNKHKRSAERTMEISVHPMHSLYTLQQKVLDRATMSTTLKAVPRSSRSVEIRFRHAKLEGSMLPLEHFGIGLNSEVTAVLRGEEGESSFGGGSTDYDEFDSPSQLYSTSTTSPLRDRRHEGVRIVEEGEGNGIIEEFSRRRNFDCLLSLVELLDCHSRGEGDGDNSDDGNYEENDVGADKDNYTAECSGLAGRLWTLLMALPTHPSLLQEVQRQFHLSRDGPEGRLGWETLLCRPYSAIHSTYVLQIMDGILQPPPELKKDRGIALVARDRFVSTGGFSVTLAHFVNSAGASPIGKLSLSIALHVLHYCLFDVAEGLRGQEGGVAMEDSDGESGGDNNIDLDTSQISSHIGEEEEAGEVSPELIAQVQESSAVVLNKLLVVAFNAAVSEESEVVKDALGTITALLASPSAAAQLTSSPKAKGLLIAVLRSNSKPVRHMATSFAVQVGKSQPVVIEWLLGEVGVVACADLHCYSIFRALSLLVTYVDDSRNVSGLSVNLEAISVCLSAKLVEYQMMTVAARQKQEVFEVMCEETGERSQLLGALELLKSVLGVRGGYSALLETPLGEGLVDVLMKDFLCPLPDQHQSYSKTPERGDTIPLCVTRQLRSAAFAVLTSCMQVNPKHGPAIMMHIQALSKSSTAAQCLKSEWGLQLAHDLKKPNIEFSGLRNHGCTCYLNSLLQQLFMNKSFRKAIMSVPLKEVYRSSLWHLSDEELLGRQYEFEWAKGGWHEGQVVHFDAESRLHTIEYVGEGGVSGGGGRCVLDIRQGTRRETGRVRVRSGDLCEEETLSEREAQAVLVLEQLQRAFCFMERSEKRQFDPKLLIDSCKTLNLEFNVYHQNDASELLDKLLDRLETAMKGKPTGGVDMYAALNTHTFGGKMLYQKIPRECSVYENDKQECGHWQGTRDEVFFKTEVTVRGCERIDEALEHVVEGELMDGDNKIMCDVCNKKKDTVRRTCFGTLPNLLIVHLKRFDLDYETFETVKLNTRMEFATTMNMYKYTKEGIEAHEKQQELEQQQHEGGEGQQRGIKGEVQEEVDGEVIDMEQYDYALQGVLVHSGVAQGGHYYSYIHDGSGSGSHGISSEGTGGESAGAGTAGGSDNWYLFDDDEVSPFSPDNIPEQCFGGRFPSARGAGDDMDRHSNALLLFYTKVKPERGEVEGAVGGTKLETDGANTAASSLLDNCSQGSRMVDGYTAFSKEVGHSNARHILTKYLIDTDLHSFVCSLLSSLSLPAAAVDAEADVSRGVNFGVHFLLDVVLHCRNRKGVRRWVSQLHETFRSHPHSALVFLQDFVFARNGHILKEFLLACRDSLARSTFVQLLSGAVSALVSCEENSLSGYVHMSDSELLHEALVNRSEGPAAVAPAVLTLLVHSLRALLKLAPNFLSTCDELFSAIGELASYPALCSCMLRMEFVPLLLYFVNSGGNKKSALILSFFHAFEHQNIAGHRRDVGSESHLQHCVVFEAVAALVGAPQRPQEDLLEDCVLTPKARGAFVAMYEEHGQGVSWSTRDLITFLEGGEDKDGVNTGMGGRQSKTHMMEARQVIDKYGSGEHVLGLEGFLLFQTDRAYYNPKAVWKDLRIFHFQNDLSRHSPRSPRHSPPSHSSFDQPTSGLPVMSNESLMSLLGDPKILATGMSVSEPATVAIVKRLTGKHASFALKQACDYLFSLLRDWNWQTKDMPVSALITTLLTSSAGDSDSCIALVLTGPSGYLTTVMNNRQQQHQHMHQQQYQYDAYNSRTLLQRYLELLKGVCAIPRVQEYVQRRAGASAASGGDGAVDQQYVWLRDQILDLLQRGEVTPSVLRSELRRTIVQVRGAGEEAVNGDYRFSRLLDLNTALYKKDVCYRNKNVTFQIYRCRMDNKAYQWFISIVPAGKEPGTNADEDFYCCQSDYRERQAYGSGNGLSLSCGGACDVKPPEGQWAMVNNIHVNKGGKAKPAPVIKWLVCDASDGDYDSDMGGDSDRDSVIAMRRSSEDSESESDGEGGIAVVDADDGYFSQNLGQ